MPLIKHSQYIAPAEFSNGLELTAHPSIARQTPIVANKRERIETPDNDFLDLDWAHSHESKLAIITHGLESSSSDHYVKGMVQALHRRDWNVLAWNFRSCSGEINRRLESYHGGFIQDLQTVLDHVSENYPNYRTISLIGFSLGGNLVLKYLGEKEKKLDSRIKTAIAISAVCDLESATMAMSHEKNKIPMRRIIRSMKAKIRAKAAKFPGVFDVKALASIRTLNEIVEFYTIPVHGFKNVQDYWLKCSSKSVLNKISIPTLLINALDDPYLGSNCFPIKEASESSFLHLETPIAGGHCSFVQESCCDEYWSEQRAIEWLSQHIAEKDYSTTPL